MGRVGVVDGEGERAGGAGVVGHFRAGWRERGRAGGRAVRWPSGKAVQVGSGGGRERVLFVQWRLALVGVGGRLAYARLSKLLRRPASEASGVCVVGLRLSYAAVLLLLTSARLLEQSDPASGGLLVSVQGPDGITARCTSFG